VWCGTDGIICGVHPARQFRLTAALLALLTLGGGGPLGAQQRAPRGRPSLPEHVDKKQEARKRPPLATRPEWTATLPAPPRGEPAFDATAAYVALETAALVALALPDGKTRWTIDLDATGGLAAGGDLVYVPTGDGIDAREAATGASRWHRALDGPLSTTPVWQNGWLLTATTRGTLTMLRAENGEPMWQRTLSAVARVPAALTGERLYVLTDDGHVAALALATGTTIWDRALGARPLTILPLDDRVFVGADDKYFYCLAAADGGRKWRWRTGGSFVGTPVADADKVYFVSLDNVLRALNRGGGSQEWQTVLPFRPVAGPFLSGQLLIVCGFAEVRAYQSSGGQVAGAADVPGELAAAPHFLPIIAEKAASPFVVITREAQALLLVPQPPPLASKPFPSRAVPFEPAIGADEIEWD
jgi:outer membrane protein assembly factor BamB